MRLIETNPCKPRGRDSACDSASSESSGSSPRSPGRERRARGVVVTDDLRSRDGGLAPTLAARIPWTRDLKARQADCKTVGLGTSIAVTIANCHTSGPGEDGWTPGGRPTSRRDGGSRVGRPAWIRRKNSADLRGTTSGGRGMGQFPPTRGRANIAAGSSGRLSHAPPNSGSCVTRHRGLRPLGADLGRDKGALPSPVEGLRLCDYLRRCARAGTAWLL